MSYITNQWVKMNPFEAAARLNELERENAALRADKERLDYLERNGNLLRLTIDAVRKEAKP